MGKLRNQNAIRAQFPNWMHRDDFTNDEELTFLENATIRITYDLKSKLLESTAVLTESATPGAYLMPGDWLEMRAVYAADGRWLAPMSAIEWARFKPTGSNAFGWIIRSDLEFITAAGPVNGSPVSTAPRTTQTSEMQLLLKPATGEDLTVHYMTSPQLLQNNQQSNPILNDMQNLYIRAMCMEAHMFVQDQEQFTFMQQDYDRLVAAANNRYDQTRTAPGAAVASAHQRLASSRPVRSM